ncbi:MAG: hypothetical protein [Caudoviricetes sp.]|nr:MAG: hypothetical protein [Caudoviricetes sp.]
MNTVKFQIMSQNLGGVVYTALELREFIEQCWVERGKLCSLLTNYERNKIRPLHVKNVGEWIKGINSAIAEINRIKGVAVRLERDLKGVSYEMPKM